MSDQSDSEDHLSWNTVESLSDQDSDESETDRGEGLFDMEAEESDGHGEDEDEDEDDARSDNHLHFFPQFSSLPAELRAMIWESVDPYLKSKGRVLALNMVKFPTPDIWESALLAEQTAPARALLAASKESRDIALKHYPNVVRIQRGYVDIRFNSANDIILLHPREQQPPDVRNFASDLQQVKYLAFDYSFIDPDSHDDLFPGLESLPPLLENLSALFCCFQANEVKRRDLTWSVSESSKQFYMEMLENLSYRDEVLKILYAWPDPNLDQNKADCVGEECVLQYPAMAKISTPPIWPLVEYSFDSGIELYEKVKRRCARKVDKAAKAGTASPSSSESSEGESFYESESDDYELDGFIVDNSSEGSEEPSEDGSILNGDMVDDDTRVEDDPDVFNGFSPLEEEDSHDEAADGLPGTIAVNHDYESEEELSDEQSAGEEPQPTTQTDRRKRMIISSDDVDDGEAGNEEPATGPPRRANKRARVVLSDSEDDEDGNRNEIGSEAEEASRPKKRTRTVLPDSEDEEDKEEETKVKRRRRPRPKLDSDEEEDEDEVNNGEEEDVSEDEYDEDEDDEEEPASKPMSLMERLRQFRSDVPVSPEGGSPGSSEDYDRAERDEDDDEEQGLSDAEFPDSAAEDGDEDGW
ncbi:hypothetical protein F5B22DRAFT_226456 [Xylaria bambusicola]|uniref:uncharacterized protein n=1 Tax=Xylaria bambusicola TaxID=326684 RepID=UPI0020085821|nr:uncharacterized protein F5B22DRAFT_226456 [Xylaria bambusicola]KAI0514664.1 hypothetical protein F5B22DRAFT_226456 [Xylaria bambusicola]